MSDARHFSDEELTAYLDGEADATLETAISAALETDEALGEQLAALDIPMGALKQGFDDLLAEAPAMPNLGPVAADPVSANTNARPRWGQAIVTFGTGIAAGLAVALFTGFGTPEPAAPAARGWVSYVASYQALYTTATLMIDDPTADEAAMQLAVASDAIGFDLSSLPQAAGLTYKRAQVLGFNGKTLIQIAYLRDDGTPVALCIIPAGPDAKAVSMGAAEGLDIARWNMPGYGFLLIGGQDADPLAQEAETFQGWSDDIAL